MYHDIKKLLISQYLLYNNHDSFDTLLIKYLVVLGADLKPYLIQMLRLMPKPSKTSSVYLHGRIIKQLADNSFMLWFIVTLRINGGRVTNNCEFHVVLLIF